MASTPFYRLLPKITRGVAYGYWLTLSRLEYQDIPTTQGRGKGMKRLSARYVMASGSDSVHYIPSELAANINLAYSSHKIKKCPPRDGHFGKEMEKDQASSRLPQ